MQTLSTSWRPKTLSEFSRVLILTFPARGIKGDQGIMLFCDRPHVKEVDFAAVRLIVSTASGLNVNGQHLVMGDEVPRGVLSIEALRQIYEPPLRLVETVEYAREDPSLVEACQRQGTNLDFDLPNQTQNLYPPHGKKLDYSSLPVHERESEPEVLTQMCAECGALVDDLTKHTRKQCKVNQRKSR